MSWQEGEWARPVQNEPVCSRRTKVTAPGEPGRGRSTVTRRASEVLVGRRDSPDCGGGNFLVWEDSGDGEQRGQEGNRRDRF